MEEAEHIERYTQINPHQQKYGSGRIVPIPDSSRPMHVGWALEGVG